jgi:hypothetical protein
MNSDKPPMNQGTASPPAKNDFRFLPVLEKEKPTSIINSEKITITEVSMIEFMK